MQSCDRRDTLIVYFMHQNYKPSALLCIFSLTVANMVAPVVLPQGRQVARFLSRCAMCCRHIAYPDAVFHEGSEEGAQTNQRPLRNGGHVRDISGGVREAPLPRTRRRLLRWRDDPDGIGTH
jgi:hypothetical protein